ncbi:hypothetical protein BN77_p10215 [Rhizobium mesoamericanum STM3625]|uniref:Uncharacterized protein n=1 Tax=Rhizobium mesoamericanum STM3625 TaxID=1211777 RepID=K0Q3K6_9HYPH|nr:hypothetical protein BN77_p10215 [Rhizobium mesoamericanum STM3625]
MEDAATVIRDGVIALSTSMSVSPKQDFFSDLSLLPSRSRKWDGRYNSAFATACIDGGQRSAPACPVGRQKAWEHWRPATIFLRKRAKRFEHLHDRPMTYRNKSSPE